MSLLAVKFIRTADSVKVVTILKQQTWPWFLSVIVSSYHHCCNWRDNLMNCTLLYFTHFPIVSYLYRLQLLEVIAGFKFFICRLQEKTASEYGTVCIVLFQVAKIYESVKVICCTKIITCLVSFVYINRLFITSQYFAQWSWPDVNDSTDLKVFEKNQALHSKTKQ